MFVDPQAVGVCGFIVFSPIFEGGLWEESEGYFAVCIVTMQGFEVGRFCIYWGGGGGGASSALSSPLD